jgi:AraC-like DNA-binding protein
VSLQRFSSREIPAPERIAFFRDVYSVVERIDILPLNDEPLVIDATVRTLDDVTIVDASCSACVSRRTARHVLDGKDDLVLSIVTRGAIARRVNEGEPVELAAGDAYLGSSEFVSEHHFGGTGCFVDIAIPRARLEPLLDNVGGAISKQKLPPSPELVLLARYARLLLEDDLQQLGPQATTHCAHHVTDLVATVAGTCPDFRQEAAQRGVRQARLRALQADIEANLARADLSLEWLAARHGISPRYVRDLFLGADTSFTAFVLEARLQRAFRLLRQAGAARTGISTIAFGAGFSDLSYFNRAFRRRFGMTPSEARREFLEASGTPAGAAQSRRPVQESRRTD